MSKRFNRKAKTATAATAGIALAAIFYSLAPTHANADSPPPASHGVGLALTNYRSENVAVPIYEVESIRSEGGANMKLRECIDVRAHTRVSRENYFQVYDDTGTDNLPVDIYAYPGTCADHSSTAVLEKHGLPGDTTYPVQDGTIWIGIR